MTKTTNRNARKLVQTQIDFQANNIFASHWKGMYVVYSYGEHWPMFICKDGQWYENDGRYSVTTSKHRSQTHPHAETIKLDRTGMLNMLRENMSHA